MKKFFNILGIILSLFLVVSCSNLLETISNDENSNKSGYVKISFDTNSTDDSAMRTVFATKDANKDATILTEIKLYGKLSSSSLTLGSNDTLLCSWDTYSDLQVNPYDAELTVGTYSFMLTAKNYGATMTQTLTNKSISAGNTTTLSFSSMAPSKDSEQTGGIYITLDYYNASSTFYKYVSYYINDGYPTLSVKLDDGETFSILQNADKITGKDGSTLDFKDRCSHYTNNSLSRQQTALYLFIQLLFK